VLDATCDRIADGAIFAGLMWWAAFGIGSRSLVVATMICLITSQVISYIKARAEASGLRGDGGLIERPERLVIVLTGAGLSGVSFLHIPWLVHVAMWLLALASVVTVLQRVHTVRTSPGATEPIESSGEEKPAAGEP
jgi:CDP-diacylglycerol--glycerol-3-phosphate 3-phosphatidyltransferase